MKYTIMDNPESIPAVFVEAWNNRDPDKLVSIFDENAAPRQLDKEGGHQMKEDENDLQPTPLEKSAGQMSEAEIDANVEDTFPASDPPAWTLGSDHRPPATSQESDTDGE